MLLYNQLEQDGTISGQDSAPAEGKHKNINDFFPLIVCLNLKKRRDRWLQMQDKFRQSRIDKVMCFPAIDGVRATVPENWPSTPGAYGCLQSHVAIVELARELGVSSVLIFEDDVEFADDFVEKLLPVLAQLPSDWHMFFLGAIVLDDLAPVGEGLSRLTKAYSTYAYAIHHSLFDTFIELNKSSVQLLDINSFQLQKQFNCYCATPFLDWVSAGYSDAQEKLENHWYLRESLVLFGQSANALLAKTCVCIYLGQNPGPRELENLYFMLEYYLEYFQGYLSVCILEQGKSSSLDFQRLPANTQHFLFASAKRYQKEFSRLIARLGQGFDYLVLSTKGLYLQPMDFRANLQMCRLCGLTSGFSRQIALTERDSDTLKRHSDGRGLNLSPYTPYIRGEKGIMSWAWPAIKPSYYFIQSGFLLDLMSKNQVGNTLANGECYPRLEHLVGFHAPNYALTLYG